MLRGGQNATRSIRGSSRCSHTRESLANPAVLLILTRLQYLPASGNEPVPIEQLLKTLPKLSYNMYFEKDTAGAVAELDKDIRRSLRCTLRDVATPPPDKFLRSPTSFLKAYKHIETVPPIPFFTKEEEDYYVEQYMKQGYANSEFTSLLPFIWILMLLFAALQFYTKENKYRNWEFSHKQGNWTIPKPALSILPIRDPVADWPLVALIVGASKYLPYLTTRVLQTAHWIQLEKPAEFNAILQEWLDDLDVKLIEVELAEAKKEVDRLKKALKEAKTAKKAGIKGEL